ncbi:uncharacterized protein LOC134695426 [Mytilus trossulus]|uniref:uncharacterized protein LOC134695426 n=1 Tax=Mytilus trossulus TaxID=6551 RepID=UPI00300427ED
MEIFMEVLIIFAVVMVYLCTDCHGLMCYKCENERNNFLCVGEYNLKQCDSGFDTCQTTVSYSEVSEQLSIIKTCTKNSSCHLQIKEHSESVPCDQTGSSWICTTCCNEDACNLNTATSKASFSFVLSYMNIFLYLSIKCII